MTKPKEESGGQSVWGFISNDTAVQSVVAIGVALMGAGIVAKHTFGQRVVLPLYSVLGKHSKRLNDPVIPFPAEKIFQEEIGDQALILKGANKSGKTTWLAESIRLHQRFDFSPFCLRGLYMNGSQTATSNSFGDWVTSQMYGDNKREGAEVEMAVQHFLSSQRIRFITEFIPLPFRGPKFLDRRRPVIIVDQLEELMRKYPSDSLPWISNITNMQTRDGDAQVILVVNSQTAVDSILGLNQGRRWKVLDMDELRCELPVVKENCRGEIDLKYFSACEANIGLYKDLKRRGVTAEGLPKEVRKTLAFWRKQYHVPYPLLPHNSWREIEDTKPEEFIPILQEALKPHVDESDFQQVSLMLAKMSPSVVLDYTSDDWESEIRERVKGANTDTLTAIMMTTLGSEAPQSIVGGSG